MTMRAGSLCSGIGGLDIAVATARGRDAIGIDLDARNRDLLPARIDECRRALFGGIERLP